MMLRVWDHRTNPLRWLWRWCPCPDCSVRRQLPTTLALVPVPRAGYRPAGRRIAVGAPIRKGQMVSCDSAGRVVPSGYGRVALGVALESTGVRRVEVSALTGARDMAAAVARGAIRVDPGAPPITKHHDFQRDLTVFEQPYRDEIRVSFGG